jgi:exopolyphosphatase/guanosine-5'-triphosphate,3'-diphosphate pyrophosphatase
VTTAVAPRWEWRTFGTRFGRAEAAFAALTPSAEQESDELYFLSAAGDTVKVRHELMDVKVLEEVDAAGLQRWAPVLKAPFPLPAADVARVFDALRVPVPTPTQEAYTLDQFVAELVQLGGAIRPVRVHKRRVRYVVGGCTAEVTEVRADGIPTRTIAIESEDPGAVTAAIRSVGLGGYANVSYPRGLAALIDRVPARYAVIDVGTNSVKFHIGELEPAGAWRTVVDRAEVTRLGEGLDTSGRISETALGRTAAAIEGMASEAHDHGVRAIAAVGTAGLRIAKDSEEVVEAIETRTGIRVEVVSGEEESRLAYLAVETGLGLGAGSVVVFDTGGGSSQFTFGHGGQVDERFSVDVGATRFTERFGLDRAVSRDVVDEALAAMGADLSRLDGRPAPDALVGMGGAMTNLTAVQQRLATYDPAVVHGSVLTIDEVERQIELYRGLDADSRRSIVGLQPKRAEVILAGACIVRTVLEKVGSDRLTVSDRGLRHGVLSERFGTPPA